MICVFQLCAPSLLSQTMVPPESFFGFKPGADYKLAGWNAILEYFQLLDESSPRVTLFELGDTNQGRPFVMAAITSEENHFNLSYHKAHMKKLAAADFPSDEEARSAAREAKIAVLITCSIHATEVGGTQASPLIAYRLASGDTPEIREILDNVILLLVPSFNPDGLELVKEWYDTYLETPYEGSSLPWLYQPYTGHDNNRDAFMMTQPESRFVNQILYREWCPPVYLDMHQMGNSGARLFLPPYVDPVNPNIHSVVIRSLGYVGQKIAMQMTADGHSGIVTNAAFNAWWQGGFLKDALYHNIVAILSEMASANIASPIFQEAGDLTGNQQGFPEYRKTTNFPAPWKGGWWRLRDIVTYDQAIAFNLLTIAARDRETLLYNYYRMGKETILRGKTEPPFAVLLPEHQRDTSEMRHLLDLLLKAGVRIHVSRGPLLADGRTYPAGTFVIKMDQPNAAYAKSLLERQEYPDLRQYPGGPPIPPYDMAGWTLPLQMGVEAIFVRQQFSGECDEIFDIPPPPVAIPSRPGYAYVFPHEENASIRAANILLRGDIPVYFAKDAFAEGGTVFPEGSMIVPSNSVEYAGMIELVDSVGVRARMLNAKPQTAAYRITRPRVGLYQPWLANMSEGWTRWVFEQYHVSFAPVHNAELIAGALNERYDAVFIPDMSPESIVEGRPEHAAPSVYAGGIGAGGLTNLRRFVEAGGTLIALDAAAELLIDEFGLPVVNTVKGIKSDDFFCPGSILRAEVRQGDFLTYGIPEEAFVFFARSPVFKVMPSFKSDSKVLVRYPADNILASGWIVGEHMLREHAVMVEFSVGEGKVILLGFEAIQRAQATASFKFVFNSLFSSTARLTDLP